MPTAIANEYDAQAEDVQQLKTLLKQERSARLELERDLKSENQLLRQQNEELKRLLDQAQLQMMNKEGKSQRVNETSEAAHRAKTAFLSTLTHELRSPLNSIIGYGDLLFEEAVAIGHEQMVSDLEIVKRSGQHLLDLINHALEISKIEAGKIELSCHDIHVGSFVAEIEQDVLPLMKKNENSFAVGMSDDVSLMQVDSVRLYQILMHLLSNAAKFTHQGEVSMSVTALNKYSKKRYAFCITDTGIGMSKSELKRAVKAFEQVDNAYNRRYEGGGLGMTIAQKLCHLMGGELLVESKKGKGSTFTVILPAFDPLS